MPQGLVNLYTRDIEAGLHFYRDLLGFAETFRTPTEGIPEQVELRLNGFTIGLGTVEAAKNAVQPPHNRGNNRNALLRDPDGNLVEIVATAGQ
ncbi:MAG: VOC family protein [Jiangellaceae bacterium]